MVAQGHNAPRAAGPTFRVGSLCVALTLATTLLASAQPASARDMTGKGGLGLMQSAHTDMVHLPTLLFRYWNRSSCWELLVGFDVRQDKGVTEVEYIDSSVLILPDAQVPTVGVRGTRPLYVESRRIYAGFGLHKLVYGTSRVSLTIGARGVAQLSTLEKKKRGASASDTGEVTNALALLAEVPLQAEFFLSDHSSVTASVGLSASISQSFAATSETDDGLAALIGAAASGRGGVSLELGGRYSGGVGYTYYF